MSLINRRRVIMAAASGGGAAFAYDDIPDQLFRISSSEGSLVNSGAVLTEVVDASAAGEAISVSGTPVYTASDSNLNGQPSFAPPGVSVPGINGGNIAFVALVVYLDSTGNRWLFDGDSSGNQCYVLRQATTGDLTSNFGATAASAESPATVGRKRGLLPLDGSTSLLWNAGTGGVIDENTLSITDGFKVGCRYNDGNSCANVAFFMACSSVPSAPLIAALEAKLAVDYG